MKIQSQRFTPSHDRINVTAQMLIKETKFIKMCYNMVVYI